jgi:hypothetical protein
VGGFSIRLEFSGNTPTIEKREYDPDLDDPGSILSDVCEVLAESGRARFLIEGFGQAAWPVDVRTDLCVALEQIPLLIRELRANREGTLSLYEQGVERAVAFRPSGDITAISCSSSTRWQPNPATIHMPTEAILRELVALCDRFCDLVRSIDRTLYEHPWFTSWREAHWNVVPLS